MIKRAKDVTLGDTLVTGEGLMTVFTVSTDMTVGTTVINEFSGNALIFEPTETVETLG